MFQFLFSPQGRVSRKAMWLGYILPYIGIAIVASGVDYAIGMGGQGLFSILVGLFYIWPSIAVTIKRFHDRDMTGWWVLWSTLLLCVTAGGAAVGAVQSNILVSVIFGVLALIVSLYFFIILYILGGTEGDNKYGQDPRQA